MTRRLFVLVLAIAACGGKKEGGDKDKVADKPAAATIDIAAINGLVPAALKDKIGFEKRDIVIERGKDKTTYTMAVPKGWTQEGKMFAHIKADSNGGFFSGIEVGSNCDGSCEPKDWEKVADKVNFKERAAGKVTKDDKGKGHRTMIADVESNGVKTTDVVVATWSDGAKKYFACTAKLDESIKDAAPAFEKACSAVNVDGDD
ncbi:MAG TPA: hypothetical protein VGO00_29645 [Kofleriaceae bacterium]|nr:hypothetical protein [Kofleriaceae bacterium]